MLLLFFLVDQLSWFIFTWLYRFHSIQLHLYHRFSFGLFVKWLLRGSFFHLYYILITFWCDSFFYFCLNLTGKDKTSRINRRFTFQFTQMANQCFIVLLFVCVDTGTYRQTDTLIQSHVHKINELCALSEPIYIYVYHFVMQLRILPIYAYLIFEHTFPICYHIISKDTICLRLFSFAAPENGSIGLSQQQTKERPSINVVFIESVNLILCSFSYWEEQALRAFTLIKIHCTIYSNHLRRLIIYFLSLIIHIG